MNPIWSILERIQLSRSARFNVEQRLLSLRIRFDVSLEWRRLKSDALNGSDHHTTLFRHPTTAHRWGDHEDIDNLVTWIWIEARPRSPNGKYLAPESPLPSGLCCR